ncbi:MAG: hypothetical protein KDA65_17175, partial [Planctomycetaceae bacterium]|nr:hypothetical protein [Planctomycetaceae bacterium]
MSRKSILTALLLGLMLSAPRLWAQDQEEPTASYQPPGEVESTVISFELLTGARGQNFAARQWYDLFSDLKIPLRIRQSVREDKPVITEEIKNKV